MKYLTIISAIIIALQLNANDLERNFYFRKNEHSNDVKSQNTSVKGVNLLRNSSFEVEALDGWWPKSLVMSSITEDDSVEGKKALKIEVNNNWTEIRSEFRKIIPGQKYIFSIYLRSDKNSKVKLSMRSGLRIRAKGKIFPGKEKVVAVSGKWKRYSLSFSFPKTMKNACFISVKPVHKGGDYSLWADCVKLEAGEKITNYSPEKVVSLGLNIAGTSDFVFWKNDKVPVTISLYSKALKNQEIDIVPTLEDLFGHQTKLKPFKIKLDSAGYSRVTKNISNKFYGSVRLKVKAVSKNKLLDVSQICWSCLYPPRKVNPEKSPFGMHVYLSKDAVELEKKMGVKWDRIHDMGAHHFTRWTWAEPHKGKFVFADDTVKKYKQNGIDLLAVLFATPKWAAKIPSKDRQRILSSKSPNSAQSFMPANMRDFDNYVATMVRHYKSYIKYWEVWNEPYGIGFWRGTPEEYVELLKTAYSTIKKQDPQAKVLGGNIYHTHTEWMDRIFKAGAMRYMDVLPYHQYGEQQDRATRYGQEKIKKLIQIKNKFGGKNIPIWNSESGENCSDFNTGIVDGLEGDNVVLPTPDYIEASAALVRKYVYSISLGVEKIMYYFSVSRDYFSNFNMFSIRGLHGNLKPTGTAYSTLAYMIDGLSFDQKIIIDNFAEVYIFKGKKRSVAVIWGNGLTCFEKGFYLKHTFKNAKQYDISGNLCAGDNVPLSAVPRYLEFNTQKIAEFINAVKKARILDTLSKIQRKMLTGAKGKDTRLEGYKIKSYIEVGNIADVAVFCRREAKHITEWRLFVKPSNVDFRSCQPELKAKIKGLSKLASATYQNGYIKIKVKQKPYYISFQSVAKEEKQILKLLKKLKPFNWNPLIPVTQSAEVKSGKKKVGCHQGNGYNKTAGLGPDNSTTYIVPPMVKGNYYIYIVVRTGGFKPDDYGPNYSLHTGNKKVSSKFVGPQVKTYDAGPGKYKNFMGTLRSEKPVLLFPGQKITIKSNRAWSSSGNCVLRKVK